jgi:hypothetical protein
LLCQVISLWLWIISLVATIGNENTFFFNALVMPNHQFVALDYFSCASYLAIVVHPAISRKEEDSRNLLKWHTKRTLADHGRGCSC